MHALFCIATAILFATVASPSPAAEGGNPASALSITFGSLGLDLDPQEWRATEQRDAVTISHIGDARTFMVVTIEPNVPADSCSVDEMFKRHGETIGDIGPSRGEGRPDSLRANGLVIYSTEIDLGCRNLAGGPIFACTHHAGDTYLFHAPGNGCHTHWKHETIVYGLLSGLRPQ